jgi:hypothetical protein
MSKKLTFVKHTLNEVGYSASMDATKLIIEVSSGLKIEIQP